MWSRVLFMSLGSYVVAVSTVACSGADAESGQSESANTSATEPVCTTIADGATNVREKASTLATIVAEIPATTALTITRFPETDLTEVDRDDGRPSSECRGNWARVSLPERGIAGYIRSDRLDCGDVCKAKERTATLTTHRPVRLDWTKVFDTDSTLETEWIARDAAGVELQRGACKDGAGDPLETPRLHEWGWAQCRVDRVAGAARYEYTVRGAALTSLTLTTM